MEFTEIPSHVEANKGRLLEILKRAERFTAGAAQSIEAEKTPDTETVLTAGEADAEGMVASYAAEGEDIDIASAHEIAKAYNESMLSAATISIKELVARASKRAQMQKAMNGEIAPDEETPNIEDLLLSYGKATTQRAMAFLEDGQRIEINTTRLEDLDEFGSATTCVVTVSDDLISRSIFIDTLGNKVVNVGRIVQPVEDELVHDCIVKLPEARQEVFLLLMGRFESEDDLNVALNEIWLTHQNSWNEEESGPLLDRVRNRALAVQHSSELNAEHGNNVPTIAHLQEILDLIA